MHAHCFRLEICADSTLLYVLELSTDQGLALFDPDDSLHVSGFGASAAQGAAWLSASDLAPVGSVAAFRALLQAHPEWDIIDVAVEIGAGCRLSTHDDGECHFALASPHDALRIVERLLPPPASQAVITALQQHPTAYVALTPDGIRVHASFDDYLAAAS